MTHTAIVSTVRNGSAHLAEMLESVLAQTHQDWSMLVIDDGSTDETPEILSAYAQRDGRIGWRRSEAWGRGHALNAALNQVGGELIANIDADDYWLPHRLAGGVEALTGRPELALVCTRHQTFTRSEDISAILAARSGDEMKFQPVDVTRECLYRNPVNHSSVLMRRAPVEAVSGYDASRRSQFDYDLWARMAMAGHRLGRIEDVLVLKRVHAGQSFEAGAHRDYVRSSLEIQKRCIRHLDGGLPAQAFVLFRSLWGEIPRPARMWARRILSRG